MFSHIEDGDGDESTAPPDLLSRGESSSSEPSEVDMIIFSPGESSSSEPSEVDMMCGGGHDTITNKVGSGVWSQPVVDFLPSDDLDLSGESL
jgi:hypothetical protein